MTLNNPQNFYHPEDDLPAYALGALDAAESLAIETHLANCFHCSRLLADLQPAALALSQAVPEHTPPSQLQAALIAQLPPSPAATARPAATDQPTAGAAAPAASPAASPAAPTPSPTARSGISNYLLPLAAVLVIGLFAASLLFNFLTANRVSGIQQESATATARLAQLESDRATANAQLEQVSAGNARADTAIQRLMAANYLMAQPATQPLRLQPTSGDSQSEGILLVTRDGRRAVLMLANTAPESPARSYRVWLTRNGQQVPVGAITVAPSGWGTMPLNPPENLYGFDSVNLTVADPADNDDLTGEMVLQTRIISPYSR